MNEKPFADRSLMIPALVGLVSLLGICLVLGVLRLTTARASLGLQTPTETAVKFVFLATEPGVVMPTQADTPTAEFFTDTPAAPLPTIFLTNTPGSTSVPVLPTRTLAPPTVVNSTALPIGITYDDADIRLSYAGSWLSQTGVRDTFQTTLHISSTVGNSVQLVYFGQKIRFAYQSGPSLGQIAIKLDTLDFVLDQSNTVTELGVWESPILTLANHTITITHISGGSINVDSFVVIDLSTPTPTPTATPTTSFSQ